jgi:heat-inducible transcriptional repressor
VRVLIGEDCELTSDLEFSVVATPYGLGDRPLGTLGIVGPSRMEYERIIPLVNFLGETLSRALAEAFSGEPDRR